MKRVCLALMMFALPHVSNLQAAPTARHVHLGERGDPTQYFAPQELIAKNPSAAAYQKSAAWDSYNTVRSANSVGVNGLTLTMDDQTVWEIAPSSAYVAKSWGPGTRFIIYPNNWTIGGWFSKYEYALYNPDTRNWVEAQLSEGPMVKYAVLTTNIDQNQGYIRLDNGSVWKLVRSSKAFAKIRDWKARQAILVGRNTGWFTNGFILINLNENEYVPVDFLGYN